MQTSREHAQEPMMILNRRTFTLGASTLAWQIPGATSVHADASMAMRLLQPGPLPDKIFGNADAVVTVVEYASLTCHHCINFHINTWPAFKTKYVESGKVRFILREFPLDPLATAGFMLARCAGDDKWYAMVDMLYRSKETWGHASNPADALLQIVRQAGFTTDSFNACLGNQELYQNVRSVHERGTKEFGVNSTPTFFVNGQRHVGALTIEQFDKILEPLLRG
jgi:protein-disulfide isomerase